MPRTKYIRNTKNKKKSSSASLKLENAVDERIENDEHKIRKIWLDQIEREYANELLKLDNVYNEVLAKIDAISFVRKSNLSPDIANQTLGDLKQDKSSTSLSNLSSTVSMSVLQLLNNTKNNTLARSRKQNISDEGYLTAAEMRASSSDRARSRTATVNKHNKTRPSRSVSRSKMPKHVSIHPSAKMYTPMISTTTNYMAMGTVTPKIRPNLPMSVLRRPKQGETAISLQGSPLMVSGIVTETCANVNIPLHDGRIISLQPTRGIRASQIPTLDDDTRNQLLALRDNINKVMDFS